MPEYYEHEFGFIVRTSDNASIPKDPRNTDYQDYLAWLETQDTPTN